VDISGAFPGQVGGGFHEAVHSPVCGAEFKKMIGGLPPLPHPSTWRGVQTLVKLSFCSGVLVLYATFFGAKLTCLPRESVWNI